MLSAWFVIRFQIIQMVLSIPRDIITVTGSSSDLKLNQRIGLRGSNCWLSRLGFEHDFGDRFESIGKVRWRASLYPPGKMERIYGLL
jgi:hypothetical protein